MSETDHTAPLTGAFVSGAKPAESMRIIGLEGREQVGQLFSYRCVVARDAGPLGDAELDELLAAPCAVGMGGGNRDAVHGVLERIEQIDPVVGSPADAGPALYLATVVPTVWLLSRAEVTRVHRGLTVPQMVREVLESYGLRDGVDFDIRTSGGVVREYMTQYRESDWHFIQRWLEHDGYFHFFRQQGTAEQLVIADANAEADHLTEPRYFTYGLPSPERGTEEVAIWSWRRARSRIPARVSLSVDDGQGDRREVRADVDPERGFGTAWEFDVHARDDDHARALARARAEQHLSDCRAHRALTDCARVNAGHRIEVSKHPSSSCDGAYLVTSVRRKLGLPMASFGLGRLPGDGGLPSPHVAEIEAVRFDVPFRMARRARWPRVDGVIDATLAGAGPTGQPAFDALGRALVSLPFEEAGNRGAAATRWIPLAHGEGAASMRAGAPVLVAHLHGDPDLPVIVGGSAISTTLASMAPSKPEQPSGVRTEWEDI